MSTEDDSKMNAMVDEIMAQLLADEIEWSKTVQVGDWVDSRDDATYLSGPQYKTKDKLYQVREVDIRTDQETGKVYSRTVIVDGDYFDPSRKGEPEKVWMSNGRVIVRNGVIVWECSNQKRIKEMIANPPAELSEADFVKLKGMAYYPDLEGTC